MNFDEESKQVIACGIALFLICTGAGLMFALIS